MNDILDAAEFVRRIRVRMRFGQLSRAPLQLLRLQLSRRQAECDWLIRPADPWDMDLPAPIREENRTLQALMDALKMRELIFAAFREVQTAQIKVFRTSGCDQLDLMMTGTIHRLDEVPLRIDSVVMRAKLAGFRFSLLDGVLNAIVPDTLWAG
jgi:hypothetical protein